MPWKWPMMIERRSPQQRMLSGSSCSNQALVELDRNRGRYYWWSLTTKSNYQLTSKTGEINKLMTHMPLLLTYFHMYWRFCVLQIINIKYMGSMAKVRNLESVTQILYQRMRRWPIQPSNLGQTPPGLCSKPIKKPIRQRRW